jgi:hypothetical protein
MGNSQKIMRDIGLNDPVTVTLPAHVWMGFIGAYAATKWQSSYVDQIGSEVIDQLYDPLHLKEREAAHQEQHDLSRALFRHMTMGQLPEVPPNMTDGE